jgi:hypothetical protein
MDPRPVHRIAFCKELRGNGLKPRAALKIKHDELIARSETGIAQLLGQ